MSDAFVEEIRQKLGAALEEQGIRARISGRVKNIASIHKKIRRQRIDVDQVYDYVAFRIVTAGVVSLALLAASGPLADGLLGDRVYAKYLRLGAAALPFTLVTLWCNDILRVTFQPWKFVAANSVNLGFGGVPRLMKHCKANVYIVE